MQYSFGCRREGTNIPLVVAACIQEVTQRGTFDGIVLVRNEDEIRALLIVPRQ